MAMHVTPDAAMDSPTANTHMSVLSMLIAAEMDAVAKLLRGNVYVQCIPINRTGFV